MSFFSSVFINLLYAFDFFGPPPPPDFSTIRKKREAQITVGSHVLPPLKKGQREGGRKKSVCHGLFLVTPESDLGAIWWVQNVLEIIWATESDLETIPL